METTTNNQFVRQAERIRWGPSDGLPAGIRILDEFGAERGFTPWEALKTELEIKLLPQIFADPSGFSFSTAEHRGKPDWLVQVVDAQKEPFCHVWFGPDPERNFAFDGLVRVGDPDAPPSVWQTYQRYSDGSYQRLSATVPTLDQVKNQT